MKPGSLVVLKEEYRGFFVRMNDMTWIPTKDEVYTVKQIFDESYPRCVKEDAPFLNLEEHEFGRIFDGTEIVSPVICFTEVQAPGEVNIEQLMEESVLV